MNSTIELSISSLPSDVICELFEHAALVDPPHRNVGQIDLVAEQIQLSRGYNLGWILLTHVCRHWRAIAIDLATLWAGIVCSLPNFSATNVLLHRSKGCSLTILIDDGNAWTQKVAFALQHIQRVESLTCRRWYRWGQAHELDRRSLPKLRHLFLSQYFEDTDMDTATLVLDAPQLLSLSLENMFFSLVRPSDALGDLRILDLQGPHALPHPAWELLELLTKTPRLEQLRLQLLVYRHSGGSLWEQYPGGQVLLDHLKAVTLTGGPHADVAAFWSRILAPDNIDIYINFRVDPPEDLAAALGRQLRYSSHDTITVNLARARHLLVSTFRLEPTARSRVILDGGGGATLHLLENIDKYTQLEHISRFNIQLYAPYTWADRPLLEFARKCFAVKQFMLHTDNPDNFAALRSEGDPIPLFPSLTILSVQFDSKALKSDEVYRQWWAKLRDMLERRSAVGLRVRTLQLDGRWGWRDAGIEAIDEEMTDSLEQSLVVEKVVDSRLW